MQRSIRFRLTAIAAVIAAGLLLGVSVLMVLVLRWQLTDNLDEGLGQRTSAIAALLATGPVDLPTDEDLLIQVIDADGTVTASSSNLRGAGPIVPSEAGIRTTSDVPGRPETFRTLTSDVDTATGPVLLVVGINFDDVTDPVRVVSVLLATTVPAVVVLLAALTWWLTGRALGPVDRMRAEMVEISGSNLGRRVREPATGDEIARLARTMNQTLDRLEDAVRRQQRFVADASHELRGPLTRIRTELEVDLTRPELADPVATERSVLGEAIALQHLVEDLLVLARSDAGAAEMTTVPVDLDDIVLREARRLGDRGRIQVDTRSVSAALVVGDWDQLGRAVRNLLDNAERHAAGSVAIALGEVGGVARLTVTDDGGGVPPDRREHIFERFTRLDEARTTDAGGSGLGLAIARDIVERHGGTIHLAESAPTCFVIELPVGG